MQDKSVSKDFLFFSFPNSDGLRKKSTTKFVKSVAQSVRLRIGLHIPLPASPATLYGVLFKQLVEYVFDFFGAENTCGHKNCIKNFGLKPNWKRKLWRHGKRWEDNSDNSKYKVRGYGVASAC